MVLRVSSCVSSRLSLVVACRLNSRAASGRAGVPRNRQVNSCRFVLVVVGIYLVNRRPVP